MAGYADLIREYKEETKYANDTFTDIYECVNSIGLYVNENVDFSCAISINEINFDNAKETLKNVKDKIVDAATKLVERIQKFTEKIGQAIKRLVDKAKVVVASKGNAAMAKILEKNEDKTLNKDVEITVFDDKSVLAIIKKCESQLGLLEGFANNVSLVGTRDALDETETKYNKYKPKVDILIKNLNSSDEDFKKAVAKKVTIKKGESVKNAYNTHVAELMKSIDPKSASSIVSNCNKRVDRVFDVCKKGKGNLDKIIKTYSKKEHNDPEAVKSAQTAITLLADIYSCTMIITHKVLDITFKTLTMSTKASAQLALGAAGKAKKEKEEE